METLLIIANLLIGAGTLLISIFLLINENRMRKITNHDLMVKSYDALNTLGLENDKNLMALAEVLYPDKKENLELLRQRIFAYIALNAVELTFLSKNYHNVRGDVADPILKDLLRSILQNKEAQNVIRIGSYDKKFTELALGVMKSLGLDSSK